MKLSRNQRRKNRHYRIRYYIKGTSECPRLNVYRSNKQFYAQIIDDEVGNTLVACNTLQIKELKQSGNKEAAAAVGALIAKKALSKNITKVVFDRSGYLYHGKVKSFAESARNNGLKF